MAATMKLKKFEVISQQDGLRLSALRAEPDEASLKGVVQLVHGMSEHKERYLPFMQYLADRGYASVIHDHRGHGKSVRSPQDLGYFYQNGDRAVVEDVRQMIAETHKLYPQVSIHLIGHSMGSLIVRCYLQRHDDRIASLTITGCVGHNAMAGLGIGLARGMSLIMGDHHRSKLLTHLAFGAYNRPFMPVTSEYAWICSAPAVVEEYDRHPLCGFVFTLNGYETLFQLLKRCYSVNGWQVKQPELPMLFISGAEDPCMNGLNGLLDAVQFLKDRGYRNIGATALPGLRHEVLNEIGKEDVYRRIVDHIEASET